MGGVDSSDWHLHPEQEAVLVGTQDMLLSRALNRGYASQRARWPMEFGLLSQDALWVYDEVQLMDVGLATSAQLQAFRDDDAEKGMRPTIAWWMSATLQPSWLRSVDTETRNPGWVERPIFLHSEERNEGPAGVRKLVSVDTVPADDARTFAERIEGAHISGTVTLVVCNTVDRAVATYEALAGRKTPQKKGRKLDDANSALADVELRLVHSRFRPAERAGWREGFLNRQASEGANRIIVATQVVEAGVDVSARTLITELAPWPSLVQRFGRCARYEGEGSVLVIDRGHDTEKAALPYGPGELTRAWDVLGGVADVGISSLEAFEEHLERERRAELYPYAPEQLLLRGEYDELFDTTPDLSGADLDIARFIRSGEERDLQICWVDWGKDNQPSSRFQPSRDALCAVPVYKAREWLKSADARPHAFDYVSGRWASVRVDRIRPGLTLVVDAAAGGYDLALGFAPKSKEGVKPLPEVEVPAEDLADAAEDTEALSEVAQYQTIAEHDREVAALARSLANACAPEFAPLLDLAARLHDWGKAHPAFAGCIKADAEARPDRPDLAKAPPSAWYNGRHLYPMPSGPRRAGFRHELASALAAFELLARHDQDHPALLGGFGPVFECEALDRVDVERTGGGPIACELAALSASDFDLVVYLVASHHGKLRASWQGSPHDQDYPVGDDDPLGLPLRGVRQGDALPAIPLPDANGAEVEVPSLTLHLDPASMGLGGRYGRSWRERSLALQARFGPGALAYLEALLRAADIRVSRGLLKGMKS